MSRDRATKSMQGQPLPHLPSDGRHRRSHASHQRIVQAMLTLVGGGNPTPNAEQVSACAGVGLRSVFRHFKDMESLHQAMSDVLAAQLATAARQPFAATDWQGQLHEMIERRSKMYEAAAPYLRAGQIHRSGSAVLRANHAKFVGVLRKLLSDRLPERSRLDRAAVEAIDLLLSFEAWQRLRDEQGLSVTRAKEVLRQTLTAILAADV